MSDINIRQELKTFWGEIARGPFKKGVGVWISLAFIVAWIIVSVAILLFPLFWIIRLLYRVRLKSIWLRAKIEGETELSYEEFKEKELAD